MLQLVSKSRLITPTLFKQKLNHKIRLLFIGEYVLVRADSPRVKIDIQGRFEQVMPT